MESKRMHRGALRTEQEIQELEALRAAAIEEFEAQDPNSPENKAHDEAFRKAGFTSETYRRRISR